MKCPICGLETRITANRLVLENDDTPDLETKVYRELEFTCVNEKCSNYEQVVDTIRNEQTL